MVCLMSKFTSRHKSVDFWGRKRPFEVTRPWFFFIIIYYYSPLDRRSWTPPLKKKHFLYVFKILIAFRKDWYMGIWRVNTNINLTYMYCIQQCDLLTISCVCWYNFFLYISAKWCNFRPVVSPNSNILPHSLNIIIYF